MTTMTMRYYVICSAYCATTWSAEAADLLVTTLDAGECDQPHVAIAAANRDAAMAAFARSQRPLTVVQ